MFRMNLGSRCQFADECKIYQGKKIISDVPLSIYRNVFCNRGIKGWKNCTEYNVLMDEKTKTNTK